MSWIHLHTWVLIFIFCFSGNTDSSIHVQIWLNWKTFSWIFLPHNFFLVHKIIFLNNFWFGIIFTLSIWLFSYLIYCLVSRYWISVDVIQVALLRVQNRMMNIMNIYNEENWNVICILKHTGHLQCITFLCISSFWCRPFIRIFDNNWLRYPQSHATDLIYNYCQFQQI